MSAGREPDNDGDGGGLWDRPLWRIWLPMLLTPPAIGQLVVASMAYTSGARPVTLASYVLQAVVLMLVAVWVFMGWPPVPGGDD